jgi:hypothetical protein
VGDIAAVISFASPARQDFHLPMAQATTDRGDPADDFSAEPAPNGGRINIGAFGDTADAELSATPPPAVPARGATAGSGGDSAGGCALGGGRGSRAWAVAFVAAMVFASRRRRRAR